jgi:hypothetical protein
LPRARQEFIERLNAARAARAEEIADLASAEGGAARWFTGWGQAALDRQAAAFLRAARAFAWEAPLDPAGTVKGVIRREPVGVVAAVIPWNSPYSAALVKLIPALLAGNTVVLKTSPENSLSMMLLAEIVESIGLPGGVVSILPADRETSEHLISHPDVDKISFTGSTRAGSRRPAAGSLSAPDESHELADAGQLIQMTDELDDAFGRGWFEQPGDVGTELLLEERIRRLRIVPMAAKAALRVRQNALVSQDDVHAAAQWRPAGRELRRIRLDPVDHGKQIGILPRLRVGVIGQPDSAAAEQQSKAESGAELGRHGVLRPGNRYTVGNRERRHPEPDLDDIPRPAGNAHVKSGITSQKSANLRAVAHRLTKSIHVQAAVHYQRLPGHIASRRIGQVKYGACNISGVAYPADWRAGCGGRTGVVRSFSM